MAYGWERVELGSLVRECIEVTPGSVTYLPARKPRIFKRFGCWWCALNLSSGPFGAGDSSMEAYENWLQVSDPKSVEMK